MKFPDYPRQGEVARENFTELLNWCRANNVIGIAGGRVVEGPNGKILFPKPSEDNQVTESGAITPWQPTFFKDGADFKCRFNLGSVNQVIAGNWNDAFTLPSDDTLKFAVLTVTTESGKVTGVMISVDTAAPTEDSIAKDIPPTEFKIVLGAVGKSSAKMIVTTNLSMVATEIFRESKTVPAVGGEAFSRWWRWTEN